jgi:hypothetical protein
MVMMNSRSAISALANPDEQQSELSIGAQTCPAEFFTLPLHPKAKFCQLFAQDLPASLSYFAASGPVETKAFYQAALGQADSEQLLKGRIVLQYEAGNKIVVISKDGIGSQIDVLVKTLP